RSSSAKSPSTRTCTGSATSAALRTSSSRLPSSSEKAFPHGRREHWTCLVASETRVGKQPFTGVEQIVRADRPSVLFSLTMRLLPAMCPKLMRAHPIWHAENGKCCREKSRASSGEIRRTLFGRVGRDRRRAVSALQEAVAAHGWASAVLYARGLSMQNSL